MQISNLKNLPKQDLTSSERKLSFIFKESHYLEQILVFSNRKFINDI